MTESARARPSLGARIRRTLKAAMYSGPGRDRWQRPAEVLDALELRPGMQVADIGAGGGYLTFRLARAVGPEGRVYAVDTDPDMTSLVADRAAQRNLTNVVTVDAGEPSAGLPGPLDLAVIVNAFHHLPDPPGYLRDLAAALGPQGRLAVIEATPKLLRFGHATDPATLREQLEAAGYTIVGEHDFLASQSFVVAHATAVAR